MITTPPILRPDSTTHEAMSSCISCRSVHPAHRPCTCHTALLDSPADGTPAATPAMNDRAVAERDWQSHFIPWVGPIRTRSERPRAPLFREVSRPARVERNAARGAVLGTVLALGAFLPLAVEAQAGGGVVSGGVGHGSAATLAASAGNPTGPERAPDASIPSVPTGLWGGVQLTSASLLRTGSRERFEGEGLSLGGGYTWERGLTLGIRISEATLDRSGSEGFHLAQTDLVAAWSFHAPGRRWVPSLHAGLNWRSTLEAGRGGFQRGGDRIHHAGVSLGAGIGYLVGERTLVDLSVNHAAGRIGSGECPVTGTGAKDCAVSTHLSAGVRWFRRGR